MWFAKLRELLVRNRLPLGAAVVVLALVGAGVAVWQARVAIAERQRAETASALIRSIFEAAGANASGQELSAAALLLQAERDFRSRPIPDPRVRAEIAATLAHVRAIVVRADTLIATRGDETAVDAARLAVQTARRVAGGNDLLTIWAVSALGRALDKAGHADESADVTREALQLARASARGNDRNPMVIDARASYAKALGGVGRYDLASDELEAAIRDATATHGAESVEVSSLRLDVAMYQLKAGRLREGIDSAARTMALNSGVPADSPTQGLTARTEYAQALILSRRAGEALPVLAGLQQGMVSAFGPLDVRTLEARANYALALAWTGALADAASSADEAIADASRKRAQATHLPWHARATIFRLQGDARAAVEQEAIALKRMADNATTAERAEVLVELATAQVLAGDPVSAERNLLKSMEQLDAAHHTATPVRADAQARLARLRLSQNRAAEALPLAQQADEFWRGFNAGNRAAGEAALWLGRARIALGQRAEGNEALTRARKLLTGSPLPSDAELLALATTR